MKNEDIPDRLWELRNDAIRSVENNSHANTAHMNFKRDWDYLGGRLKEIGKEMEELAAKYVQEDPG